MYFERVALFLNSADMEALNLSGGGIKKSSKELIVFYVNASWCQTDSQIRLLQFQEYPQSTNVTATAFAVTNL